MITYPLLPLTASLASGGWKLEQALLDHDIQDASFEEGRYAEAIEAAFELGWNGVELDRLLCHWLVRGHDVMAVICRHSNQLGGGGLSEAQATMMLGCLLMDGDICGLADALANASFHEAVPVEVADYIRKRAEQVAQHQED